MRTVISLAAIAAVSGLGWGIGRLPHSAIAHAQTKAALYDWSTDGGDNQRTGWNKQEKTLTKDTVPVDVDPIRAPGEFRFERVVH